MHQNMAFPAKMSDEIWQRRVNDVCDVCR